MSKCPIAACFWIIGLVVLELASCNTLPREEGGTSSALPVVKPLDQSLGPVSNSVCVRCHEPFDSEPLALSHLKQRIPCVACHGPSDAHGLDRTPRAKTDWVWARAEVESLCKECHKGHKSPLKVLSFRMKWGGKTRPNGRVIGAGAICTDCHGGHVIPCKKESPKAQERLPSSETRN